MRFLSHRKRTVLIGSIGVLVVIALIIGVSLLSGITADNTPTYTVKRGEFHITMTESGEIRAARGEKVIAPRVHGNLKIVHLWPEGEKVDVGDLIIQFDREDYAKAVTDAEGELGKAKADFTKAKASQEQRIAELESQIEDREAALRLAEISLQKSQYSSLVQVEQAEMELKRANLALEQAKQNLETQRIVDKVELEKYQLQINQKTDLFEKAKRGYESLSIHATRPGIVVYERIWKGGDEPEKVAVGDSRIWGGMALVDLPDLSLMQVASQIGEVDAKRVNVGQPVLIRLDAFPGPVFHGHVAKIAPMANPYIDARNVQVFEMIVDINEQDDRLKPGMSASAEIVLESIPNLFSVPVESIFEKNGESIVYCLKGRSFKPVTVRLGKRNSIAVAVESGIQEGEKVALKDPTLRSES
ncbi:MAG: efflux RND transporter periplasmic adaptor subunit [Candidatus Latescibacteria bacterium]|nr:efflux RND transporter periplasmic adaptor subunit [Candidatus Latescibacterota bacterium]